MTDLSDVITNATTDALILSLAADPSDRMARLALADAYEEAGVRDRPVPAGQRNVLNSALSILRGPGRVEVGVEGRLSPVVFVSDEVDDEAGDGRPHVIMLFLSAEAEAMLPKPAEEDGAFDVFGEW